MLLSNMKIGFVQVTIAANGIDASCFRLFRILQLDSHVATVMTFRRACTWSLIDCQFTFAFQ